MTENKEVPTPKVYTKYDPDYCESIIKHLGEGYSVESFAGVIGVHRSTIYEWLREYPEFRAAKRIADEKSRLWAETKLKEQIEGKLKSHPVPLLFYLKNRFPSDWRDRKEIVNEKEAVEDVSNLSIEDQLEKIEKLKAHLVARLKQTKAEKPIEIEAVKEVESA